MREHTRNALFFYLGLPAVIGFVLGSNQTGAIGQHLPWWASILFWVTATLMSWLVFHLGTVAAAYLLRPWEPPLIVKLAVGLLFASLPARLMINDYAGAFAPLFSDGYTVRTLPQASLSWAFAAAYAKIWSGPYVLWISANIFFDRIVGFSRYRPRPRHEPLSEPRGFAIRQLWLPGGSRTDSEPPAGPPDRALPAVSMLLSRLPPSLGFNIVAIKSEDHYLRVFTDHGDALILYKLSTAIEELEALGYAGLRVHRSYWVRREAISAVHPEGRNLAITLSTGLNIPVSQTYRETVRTGVVVNC